MEDNSNRAPGKLYLIPSLMGEVEPLEVLPLAVKKVIDMTQHYIVENEKSARAFIKKVLPSKSQDRLRINVLNKYTQVEEVPEFLNPCLDGHHVGVISEAGAPGVADPGGEVVMLAHQKGIRVVPLVGPSSILMAMMASGMNGQNFAFNGYLPIDKSQRSKKLKSLEKLSQKSEQSQIFMETPYRNMKMFEDLTSTCSPDSLLCIARDITLDSEMIKTQTIAEWKKNKPDLEKKPTIFILSAPAGF
ncbi:MAG TPA: SAM-dependent methyltransferase [Cryomorphaceae bacterium]|nr:SAM-dependent methyltransferase [Owenweeksia sp.]HBF19340.1 SAM-dependent methyltransferase [Cryomorphaceae bacterium]HCQ17226.1 SAM-dependent methyltransferase [Cryomorphaceae bacterium]|tara:strand:+ start:821 stop:1558 length:738 start_codon:yes stop_codon:yes gene_type:complete